MRYLSREEINTEKWDALIEKSEDGLVYALSWYLDIIVDEWAAFVWEQGEQYVAVFPMPFRHKWGLNYVYPPFFIQQLGLFSIHPIEKEKRLNEVIIQLDKKFSFVELYIHSEYKGGLSKSNYIRSLMEPYDELVKSYSKNHKRNLKKSQGLDFVKDIEASEVIKLFRKNRGDQLGTFKSSDYFKFQNLVNKAIQMKFARCVGAHYEGILLAGAVVFEFKNRVTFLFSGMNAVGKEKAALFYIIDQLIRQKSGQDILFDFEGGSTDSIARFYKGFGAHEEKYTFLKINNLPTLLKWLKK